MPVFAEEKSATDYDLKTREVVVTATRTEQEIKEIPNAVEVITAADIKKLGAENMTAALRRATSINLSKAAMAGNQVSIRGMDSAHTLILVDGKRIAGEDASSTSNVYELNRINLDNIERIEIIRGPGSSLYGSDALGGVINVITKRSTKQQTTQSFVFGSEESSTSTRFDFGKQGKLAVSADIRFTDVRKKDEALSTNTNMFGDKSYFNISADYELDKNKKLVLDLEYMEENQKTYYQDVGTSSINQKEWFDNERYGYSLAYKGKTTKGDYELRTYFNRLKKESRKTNKNVWTDFDHAKYDTWVVEGRNSMQVAENHLVTFGGEYRQYSYKGTRLGEGADNVYTDNYLGLAKKGSEKTINSKAIYLQDEWVVNERLLFTPSFRLDEHSSFGSNFSPKAGATYKFSDNSRFKTSYGKGFRAPTISLLYMDMRRKMGSKTVTVLGNPNLQPEETTSFEFSLEAERDNNWAKISYFNNDVTNLISTERLATTSTETKSRYININKAQINGIETEIGRKLNKNFSVKLTNTYLDATDKNTGARLTDRAKNISSLQLEYADNTAKPLSITLWQEWLNDYNYIPSGATKAQDFNYSSLNLAVHKTWNKSFSSYVGIDNIFNNKVDELNVDGRVWRLGLEMKL